MARPPYGLFLLSLALCGCATQDRDTRYNSSMESGTARAAAVPVPPLESSRKINEQDCSKSVDLTGGNLRCK
jgi:hypothetical protein